MRTKDKGAVHYGQLQQTMGFFKLAHDAKPVAAEATDGKPAVRKPAAFVKAERRAAVAAAAAGNLALA